MAVGVSEKRVDAYEKVTGRAKYTDDLAEKNMLVAKVFRSTIANGVVKSIDTSEAEKIPGVVKIITCFDVPQYKFPTAGHPWSTDPAHQDVADRLLLTSRVRYYGDDVAAVIAEDEVAANRAIRAIKAEYEEYPVIAVAAHHIDTNHHVNNAQYVEIAREVLPAGLCIRELRVEYKKAAVLGDNMIPRVSVEAGCYTVALCDTEGKPYAIVWLRSYCSE